MSVLKEVSIMFKDERIIKIKTRIQENGNHIPHID